jgi:phosphate transport system substrate-binding protein
MKTPIQPIMLKFVAVLALLGCLGTTHALTEIRVGGTGVGTLVLDRLAASYRTISPQVVVKTIHPPLGSSGGLRALSAGVLDVAVISLSPGQQLAPLHAASDEVTPWVATPMVFTGKDLSGGSKFTLHQVSDIYAGKTTRWPQGGLIRLVTRPKEETDTKILKEASKEMEQATEQAMVRLGMSIAENDLINQQMLERTPGSFGTIALGQIRLSGSSLKPASLNGIEPSLANLRAGAYPLSKPLYIVVPHAAGAEVRAFVQYLKTAATLHMLEQQGFVPMDEH